MGNPSDPKFDLEELSAEGDPFDFGQGPGGGPEMAGAEGKAVRKKPPMPSPGGASSRQAAQLAAEVPVQVVAVLGKKATTVKEIVSLKKGQVLELNRFPNEAIDLVANGKLMAKGELVEIDGKLGVRIIKIFE